ncbi:unnamed protein product [Caenorhabditis sp. 36 PRJEB53466]|nr:unnamed protein product [Caenorhabditis sp. 36 PRJEB53466]
MSQRDLWKALSGVLCIYKHSGISSSAIKKLITNKISESVAEIESTSCLRLPLISLPVVEPHEKHHPLVSGRSIRSEDIQLLDALPLATTSSGICLFGINDGCESIPNLMANSWTNVYKIEAILKNSAEKISRHRVEKVISRMESEFRAASFQHANVDLQSSEAFELARRGLPRAQLPGAQVFYSIGLNWFRSPRFHITAQCSGEDDEMLRRLIEHIGANLESESTTIRVQRHRFGPFGGEDCLLEKQISLQNIARNIHLNRKILAASESMDTRIVEHRSTCDEENEENGRKREIFDGLGLKESTKIEDYDAMRPAWHRNYN